MSCHPALLHRMDEWVGDFGTEILPECKMCQDYSYRNTTKIDICLSEAFTHSENIQVYEPCLSTTVVNWQNSWPYFPE